MGAGFVYVREIRQETVLVQSQIKQKTPSIRWRFSLNLPSYLHYAKTLQNVNNQKDSQSDVDDCQTDFDCRGVFFEKGR